MGKSREIPDDDVLQDYVLKRIRHLPKDGRSCPHMGSKDFDIACPSCAFELGGRERAVEIAGFKTLAELRQALAVV